MDLHIDLPVVLSASRDKRVVYHRRALAHALRGLGWSLPRIGRALGRHHTSVLSLLKIQGWKR